MNEPISRRTWLSILAASGVALATQKTAEAFDNSLEPCNVWPAYASNVRFYTRGHYRYVTSNDIPDHKVGHFPDRQCPNAISPQDFHFRMPLHPVRNSRFMKLINRIDFGVALDGVVFDPGTAGFWHQQRDSIWNYALLTGFGNLGLDASHAHVQRDGTYHYHGVPTELIKSRHAWGKVMLIGYAADGFPIYGPWGYAEARNVHSNVRELRTSYRLKRGERPGSPDGPGGRYDGRYTGDFEYVHGLGDLDQANGRYGITPEYPDGTYYYVASHAFPFIPRYFRGTPDRSFYKQPPRGGRRGGRGGGKGFGPGGGGGGFGRPGPGPRPFGPPGADGGY